MAARSWSSSRSSSSSSRTPSSIRPRPARSPARPPPPPTRPSAAVEPSRRLLRRAPRSPLLPCGPGGPPCPCPPRHRSQSRPATGCRTGPKALGEAWARWPGRAPHQLREATATWPLAEPLPRRRRRRRRSRLRERRLRQRRLRTGCSPPGRPQAPTGLPLLLPTQNAGLAAYPG